MARRIGGMYVPEGAAALKRKEAANLEKRSAAASKIEVVDNTGKMPMGTIDEGTMKNLEARYAQNDAAAMAEAQAKLRQATEQGEQAA